MVRFKNSGSLSTYISHISPLYMQVLKYFISYQLTHSCQIDGGENFAPLMYPIFL